MAGKAKNTLINTFLELSKTENFDKITVTSLVEKCGISRQTFYYHFNDIHEMLKWAFETETDAICATQVEGKWYENAKLYADFLNRYDCLLRSAIGSVHLLELFNLLNNSFNKYITSYLEKKAKKHKIINADASFLVDCMSLSFTGLVYKEIQKEKSDYDDMFNKIVTGFKQISE